MKKIFKLLSLVLAVILAFAMCACGDNGDNGGGGGGGNGGNGGGGGNVTPPPIERPTEAETRALNMVDTVFEHYKLTGGTGDAEYINFSEYPVSKSKQSGYLWSNFCALGMQYSLCKLYPDNAEYKQTYKLMLQNLKYFKNASLTGDQAKYHSGRGNSVNAGSGDVFFDDNIWVARNFMFAYEIFPEETFYLEEARRVNNYVRTGWDDTLGGNVWSEPGLKNDGTATAQQLERGLSANACAILMNAMLYKFTDDADEKAEYLEWAEKYYNFCKKMQNTPESYDYWNGIETIVANGKRSDGSINKVHYAYNSGSMILANLMMYDITKTESYLADAKNTATAAYNTFCVIDMGTMETYFSGDPWFATILMEAFVELSAYDKALAKPYIQAFSDHIALAYKNRSADTGLVPYTSTKPYTDANNATWVIHQVGSVESAILAATAELAA